MTEFVLGPAFLKHSAHLVGAVSFELAWQAVIVLFLQCFPEEPSESGRGS